MEETSNVSIKSGKYGLQIAGNLTIIFIVIMVGFVALAYLEKENTYILGDAFKDIRVELERIQVMHEQQHSIYMRVLDLQRLQLTNQLAQMEILSVPQEERKILLNMLKNSNKINALPPTMERTHESGRHINRHNRHNSDKRD